MVEADLDPVRARFRKSDIDLGNLLGRADAAKGKEVDWEYGKSTLITGAPESGSGPRLEMIPVPDSPSLSVQSPLPRGALDIPQPIESSSGRTCAPSEAPTADGVQFDGLTWDTCVISVPNDVVGRRNLGRP